MELELLYNYVVYNSIKLTLHNANTITYINVFSKEKFKEYICDIPGQVYCKPNSPNILTGMQEPAAIASFHGRFSVTFIFIYHSIYGYNTLL